MSESVLLPEESIFPFSSSSCSFRRYLFMCHILVFLLRVTTLRKVIRVYRSLWNLQFNLVGLTAKPVTGASILSGLLFSRRAYVLLPHHYNRMYLIIAKWVGRSVRQVPTVLPTVWRREETEEMLNNQDRGLWSGSSTDNMMWQMLYYVESRYLENMTQRLFIVVLAYWGCSEKTPID